MVEEEREREGETEEDVGNGILCCVYVTLEGDDLCGEVIGVGGLVRWIRSPPRQREGKRASSVYRRNHEGMRTKWPGKLRLAEGSRRPKRVEEQKERAA